ncbi:MAG TPA: hypothetical protein VFO77_16595 [Actinoplanes sp.]|nr:hypothetical protein [Actinoplanes sp.]
MSVPNETSGPNGSGAPSGSSAPNEPYDPLRLCVYATVALIAWLVGPLAVVGFAALGFVGYWRARRAGLKRSRCLLRDTRLVLGYLAALALAGLAGVAWQILP